MCGPCNPDGVALPVIMILGVTHYHLMIIINHKNCDSSPTLGAFQRIWGIYSLQDSISIHVCQCGQDNVKLYYKVMDQDWFSPSFICENRAHRREYLYTHKWSWERAYLNAEGTSMVQLAPSSKACRDTKCGDPRCTCRKSPFLSPGSVCHILGNGEMNLRSSVQGTSSCQGWEGDSGRCS